MLAFHLPTTVDKEPKFFAANFNKSPFIVIFLRKKDSYESFHRVFSLLARGVHTQPY